MDYDFCGDQKHKTNLKGVWVSNQHNEFLKIKGWNSTMRRLDRWLEMKTTKLNSFIDKNRFLELYIVPLAMYRLHKCGPRQISKRGVA